MKLFALVSTSSRRILLILVLLVTTSLFQSVYALGNISTGWRVDGMALSTINAYSECRDVTAPAGKSIFVPTGTIAEWNAFKSFGPPLGAVVNTCLV